MFVWSGVYTDVRPSVLIDLLSVDFLSPFPFSFSFYAVDSLLELLLLQPVGDCVLLGVGSTPVGVRDRKMTCILSFPPTASHLQQQQQQHIKDRIKPRGDGVEI